MLLSIKYHEAQNSRNVVKVSTKTLTAPNCSYAKELSCNNGGHYDNYQQENRLVQRQLDKTLAPHCRAFLLCYPPYIPSLQTVVLLFLSELLLHRWHCRYSRTPRNHHSHLTNKDTNDQSMKENLTRAVSRAKSVYVFLSSHPPFQPASIFFLIIVEEHAAMCPLAQ